MKRFVLEAVALVALAVICALTSNALASRERKMALVGYYPSATSVPKQSTEEPPPIAAAAPQQTATTTTAAPAPIATTTTVAPVTTATAQPRTPATAQPATATTPQPRNPATPNPSTPAPQHPSTPVAQFKPHPDKPYIEIPFSDVKALHDAGALFLDARRTSIYEAGHIAGARPFSVWESDIDEKVKKLYEERQDPADQAKPIVAYCSGGDCEDSHMLAQKLWGVLFNNVYVYKDGYPDWQKHGGAVHTGATP